MRTPTVSIVIPSRNSEHVISYCLHGIINQNYPKDKIEIFVVDNGSTDRTIEIARRYGATVLSVHGDPPQVCLQRNRGAEKSKGEYILILDHDMEMKPGVLRTFVRQVEETGNRVDAWYIPEIVVAGNAFLSGVRTLEKRLYDHTVINAARIIKRASFRKTKGYDPQLSGGPADWDMDNQLRFLGYRFEYVREYLYHHEERVTLFGSIGKKSLYVEGCERYIAKWKRTNPFIYRTVVLKQFSPWYRYAGIFLEKGNWKNFFRSDIVYIVPLIIVKLMMGVLYVWKKKSTRLV